MGQIFLPENIPNIVRGSSTTVTLAATNFGKTTRINLGGQQYVPSGTLTLTTSTTGANGLDTGALAAWLVYYVYAIVHQTSKTVALVASLVGPGTGPTMPSGYGTAYRFLGAFMADGAATVGSVINADGNEVVSSTMSLNSILRGSSNGSTFTNSTLTRNQAFRKGERLHFSIFVTFTGTPGGGTGAFQFLIPNLQIDATRAENSGSNGSFKAMGILINNATGASYTIMPQQAVSSSNIALTMVQIDGLAGASASASASSPVAVTSDFRMYVDGSIPITGWNATLL